MLELASGFYKNYLISPEVSILIIGLDDSGKTTLLERLKVTEFKGIGSSTGNRIVLNKLRSQHTSTASEIIPNEHDHATTVGGGRRRKLLSCPAPKMYRNTNADDDEEFQPVVPLNCVKEETTREDPSVPQKQRQHHLGPILEDSSQDCQTNGNSCTPRSTISIEKKHNQTMQYDMKKDKTMFPQHLIRPTVGMNLGKIEACNAKVKFYDLGGSSKMRPMWERYYNDVDAVVYVVDVSPMAKVTKLMESRAFYRCMRDDEAMAKVPVLIFANKTDTRQRRFSYEHDDDSNDNMLKETSLLDIAELFLSAPRGSSLSCSSTSSFLSHHGHEDNVEMFAGSAKTGEGVRDAFEWLIQRGSEEVRSR